MVLSAVGGALVVLVTVIGAVTGSVTYVQNWHESPHHVTGPLPLPLRPSQCPPATEYFDLTQTDVLYVQETVTATSINFWPVDIVVTKVVLETTTSYLPELVTVTPLPPYETFYVTVTTPLVRGIEEYYVSTTVETTSTWRTVKSLLYVMDKTITEYLPLTETVTTTISSSFFSTYTHHTSLVVTEYSVVTSTMNAYETVTSISKVFDTLTVTKVVNTPRYTTITSVAAFSTVPVIATASCVPVAAPVVTSEYKGSKASGYAGESVHEKMLKVKEFLRDKFTEAYDKGIQSFDFHIDKLKKKLDQSKVTSSNAGGHTYATEPSLRKSRPYKPFLSSKASQSGGLGSGKALSTKGTAGSGSGSDLAGDLSDLKAFAGAFLEGFKSSSLAQKGQGTSGSLFRKRRATAATSETGFKSYYPRVAKAAQA